ncbi:MAG TPA: hypothetical protein VFL91_03590 [Thermomicrobiales bacterium]|nr:hypothetical protein [Thermomicrobiales bacterium]
MVANPVARPVSRRTLSRRESAAYRELRTVAAVLNRIPTSDPAWDTLNAMFRDACAAHDATLRALGEYDECRYLAAEAAASERAEPVSAEDAEEAEEEARRAWFAECDGLAGRRVARRAERHELDALDLVNDDEPPF